MTQQILVAVIVVIAFVVSAWKLAPARQRLRALLALDGWVSRRPGLAGWRERRLKPRIQRAAGTGCSGCAANVGTRPHHPPQ